MQAKWRILGALILMLLLSAGVCASASWPKIGAALDSWSGMKKISLRTSLADPFASQVVQDLLEALLDRGYSVTNLPVTAEVSEGLVLDLRLTGNRPSVTLSKPGGTILAFERQAAEVAPRLPPVATPSLQSPPEKPLGNIADLSVPTGPIELPGQPRQVALLSDPDGDGAQVALLGNDSLKVYRVSMQGLEPMASYPSPGGEFRALHLDVTPHDQGEVRIAAVWGEDIQDIYDGTDTRLHGRIFTLQQKTIRPVSEDLGGYLRFYEGKGYFQERGAHQLFAGTVVPLTEEKGRFEPGKSALTWWKNLLADTPIALGEMLELEGNGSAHLVSGTTGQKPSAGQLLENLGPFRGPQVAIRLKDPEYRSGLGKEDRVTETYYHLPTRAIPGPPNSIYTVNRQRTPGLPLVGKATGKDAIVSIVRSPQGLRLDHPFSGVEAYIEDFSIYENASGVAVAILLVNEKEDGSGKAYLLFQSQR